MSRIIPNCRIGSWSKANPIHMFSCKAARVGVSRKSRRKLSIDDKAEHYAVCTIR